MIDLSYQSPEEELKFDFLNDKNIRVYLKRDDLIHPFISGNKWRKLKYSLRRAGDENKRHLVTFGGAYSNHILATSCAAAKFGFKSTAFIRGEKVQNETIMLCKLFGMNLLFVDRESYRDKPALFSENFGSNPEAYFIDEGGSGPEAVKGCAEIINELTQSYDHIFCASGTGATAAGILKGLQLSALTTRLHSVPVLKGADFLKQEIEKFLPDSPAFEMHTNYHFGGYAKSNPALFTFIHDFATSTGILLDPVYTAKMMFALFDLIKHDYFTPGSKILAIHTGGLLGLLGMSKQMDLTKI